MKLVAGLLVLVLFQPAFGADQKAYEDSINMENSSTKRVNIDLSGNKGAYLKNDETPVLVKPGNLKVKYKENSDCAIKFDMNGKSFIDETLCNKKKQ